MRNLIIAIAVGGNLVVWGSTYVALTRTGEGIADYSRKDVLSLNYLNSSVSAVSSDNGVRSRLAMNLNLVVPDTANIRSICQKYRNISRLIGKAFAKTPVEILGPDKTNIDDLKPGLLKAVRKSLGSNHIVDLDYTLRAGSILLAYPRYQATRVDCPR